MSNFVKLRRDKFQEQLTILTFTHTGCTINLSCMYIVVFRNLACLQLNENLYLTAPSGHPNDYVIKLSGLIMNIIVTIRSEHTVIRIRD